MEISDEIKTAKADELLIPPNRIRQKAAKSQALKESLDMGYEQIYSVIVDENMVVIDGASRIAEFRKRKLPSTPCSFQSRSFSGGESDRQKSLTVSAPYLSTISSGSTMFFLDFDIFSTRPISTGLEHVTHNWPFGVVFNSFGYRNPWRGQR